MRKRIALGIAYAGTAYHGWQIQQAVGSIQGHLQTALAKIAQHPIVIIGSGRTDTGVHAVDQVVHFDTACVREMHAWVRGGNCFLPKDIRILWAKEVPVHFHARYSALARSYRYLLYCDAIASAIYKNHTGWISYDLDVEKMREAAKFFIGEHDFSAFRAAGCQSKSPYRRIMAITIQQKAKLIMIDIKANAFLYHMVRNFIGVFIQIGSARQPVCWAKVLLDTKDRRLAGITAPASGLYLMQIDYPLEFNLPKSDITIDLL